MASIGRSALNLCTRAVSRRAFTTGRVSRSHPPGLPNDTMPFIHEEFSKWKLTIGFIIFFSSGLSWPILAARDQARRIGAAVEAGQGGDSDD